MTQEYPALPGEWVEKLTVENALGVGEKVCKFGEITNDLHGRPVHLGALEIRVDVPYTAVALTMPADLPGALVASIIDAVKLKVGSHFFIEDLDGLDLLAAARIRLNTDVSSPPLIVDADATSTVSISLYIPFIRPQAAGSARFDGAIPVACFQGDRNPNSDFRFFVRTSARNFPGVTFDTPTSVEVWAHLVALDEPRIPHWAWRAVDHVGQYAEYTSQHGAYEAVLMVGADGTDGDQDHAGMTSVKMKLNGQPVFDDLTATELTRQAQMIRKGLNPFSGFNVQTPAQVDVVPIVIGDTDQSRTKMPRGVLRVEWNGNGPVAGQERILYMMTGVRTRTRRDQMLRALGAPTDPAKYVLRPAGRNGIGSIRAEPILDVKAVWRGMPWKLPAMKAQDLL